MRFLRKAYLSPFINAEICCVYATSESPQTCDTTKGRTVQFKGHKYFEGTSRVGI